MEKAADRNSMFPVFVDNIPKEARTFDLRAAFSKYGEIVEVTIVSDHGFVNFKSPSDAMKAIEAMNGTDLFGARLLVDVSKELEDYLAAAQRAGSRDLDRGSKDPRRRDNRSPRPRSRERRSPLRASPPPPQRRWGGGGGAIRSRSRERRNPSPRGRHRWGDRGGGFGSRRSRGRHRSGNSGGKMRSRSPGERLRRRRSRSRSRTGENRTSSNRRRTDRSPVEGFKSRSRSPRPFRPGSRTSPHLTSNDARKPVKHDTRKRKQQSELGLDKRSSETAGKKPSSSSRIVRLEMKTKDRTDSKPPAGDELLGKKDVVVPFDQKLDLREVLNRRKQNAASKVPEESVERPEAPENVDRSSPSSSMSSGEIKDDDDRPESPLPAADEPILASKGPPATESIVSQIASVLPAEVTKMLVPNQVEMPATVRDAIPGPEPSKTAGHQASPTNATDVDKVTSTTTTALEGPPAKDEEEVQEVHVGNLLAPVEEADLERLFDVYGNIREIRMDGVKNGAVVVIECSRETADEAIKVLDRNHWMDNLISVKFNQDEVKVVSKVEESLGDSQDNSSEQQQEQEERGPRPRAGQGGGPSGTKDNNVETAKDQGNNREFLIYCATNNKNFMKDMVDLFGGFGGTVRSSRWEGPCIAISLESTERQALRCVQEVNKVHYKGQELRVKFRPGSAEDSEEFRRRHQQYFRNYPDDLLPATRSDSFASVSTAAGPALPAPPSQAQPQPIIGVLPPSSSLGAFAALPDPEALSSILKNAAKASFMSNSRRLSTGQRSNSLEEFSDVVQNNRSQAVEENSRSTTAAFLRNVEGQVHSVNNRMITVKVGPRFDSWQHQAPLLVKLTPGQMFVNGKSCLGYLIRDSGGAYHSWPAALKAFLHQGAPVRLDAVLMGPREAEEAKEACGEDVAYSAPLVWRSGRPRPKESALRITRASSSRNLLVFKGIVVTLYPKWGIVETPQGNVFFEAHHLYVDKSLAAASRPFPKSTTTRRPSGGPAALTLLDRLEKGYTVAVQCSYVSDYLEMSEVARSAPGFTGRTDNLKFLARLVWNLTLEVDPFKVRDFNDDDEDENDGVGFLSTSGTLNKPLPNIGGSASSSSSAVHAGWTGTVEEVHLPAGGLVLLDQCQGLETETLQLGPDQRYAYFHRSRLYVNGAKLQSSDRLDLELVPGDRVTLDVVENMDSGASTSCSSNCYVSSSAHWVALAVHVNNSERGVAIARDLRMEGYNLDLQLRNSIGVGRIVHFFAPREDPNDATTSGIAIIDSGDFAGQRVEFDASQCFAFGCCLESADLSQIFHYNEPVYIQVKPYNSYCLERLWIGSKDKRIEEYDLTENQIMTKYLFDHGLDLPAFQALIRGKFPPRPFIPLGGQVFKGKVKALKSHVSGDGTADRVVIEADVGDILFIEAGREVVYVHGHWMGRADLRYVLQNEEVKFEFHPVYDKWDRDAGAHDLPKASLVWLGDEESRPTYIGQGSRPTITASMDSALWEFVATKNMDQKMFRALVDGRLPPKENRDKASQDLKEPIRAVGPSGQEIDLDRETIAQAALLKQMKETFGENAFMQSMMLFMADQTAGSSGLNNPAAALTSSSSAGAGAAGRSKELMAKVVDMMKAYVKDSEQQQQQQQQQESKQRQVPSPPSEALMAQAVVSTTATPSGETVVSGYTWPAVASPASKPPAATTPSSTPNPQGRPAATSATTAAAPPDEALNNKEETGKIKFKWL